MWLKIKILITYNLSFSYDFGTEICFSFLFFEDNVHVSRVIYNTWSTFETSPLHSQNYRNEKLKLL